MIKSKVFLSRFPEFDNLEPDFIAMVLAEAEMEINPNVWGKKYPVAAMYLTADKIACSPLGEPAMLEPGNNMSTYRREYERLRQSVAVGMRVV